MFLLFLNSGKENVFFAVRLCTRQDTILRDLRGGYADEIDMGMIDRLGAAGFASSCSRLSLVKLSLIIKELESLLCATRSRQEPASVIT